jgi:small subunit ribosomal protein S15Ae
MVRISVLGDALKTMYNAEKRGKRQVLIRPASKVVIKFLQLMQKHGYINEFEFVDDHRAGKIVVELNGRLNKCGVISPRYDISHTQMEDWVARLLPSRLFGVIVLTTSAGIMDHETARAKGVGGKGEGRGGGRGGRAAAAAPAAAPAARRLRPWAPAARAPRTGGARGARGGLGGRWRGRPGAAAAAAARRGVRRALLLLQAGRQRRGGGGGGCGGALSGGGGGRSHGGGALRRPAPARPPRPRRAGGPRSGAAPRSRVPDHSRPAPLCPAPLHRSARVLLLDSYAESAPGGGAGAGGLAGLLAGRGWAGACAALGSAAVGRRRPAAGSSWASLAAAARRGGRR